MADTHTQFAQVLKCEKVIFQDLSAESMFRGWLSAPILVLLGVEVVFAGKPISVVNIAIRSVGAGGIRKYRLAIVKSSACAVDAGQIGVGQVGTLPQPGVGQISAI